MAPTFISEETHRGELARSIVKPNHVLMNIVGPPLGKVSIVPDTHPEWNINQAIAVFPPLQELNNRYLAYFLISDWATKWLSSRAKATAGQFNLTLQLCRELPIPLAPLEEQNALQDKLKNQLAGLSQLTQAVALGALKMDKLQDSFLREAFAGKLVPQDPSDEPASVLLERIRAQKPAGGTKRGRGKKAAA